VRPAGAQRFPNLLRDGRGSDPSQPSVAADTEDGGLGPRSAQSHLLRALRRRWPAISPSEQLLLASLLQAFYGSDRSGCYWSSCTTTCCSAGFWASSCMIQSDTQPRSQRTGRVSFIVEIMERFLEELMASTEVKPLLSDEHFSANGTLLLAWVSNASLEPIDGRTTATPFGPWQGIWPAQNRKEAGQG